jgi:large subunit ribosomal protein L15
MSILNQLTSPKPKRKRVGRGAASGQGKTSGRGQKGAGSRSGYKLRRGTEGGQCPLFTRIPTRGFSNARFKQEWNVINLGHIEGLFEKGSLVDREALVAKKLIKENKLPVKLLGQGEMSTPIHLKLNAVSASARAKVEACKGAQIELI